jgi:GxxExxY protein
MNTGDFSNAEGAQDPQKSQKDSREENDFSREIIGAAVEVQRVLGTGLLESAYAAALAIELAERELGFAQRVAIPGSYKGRSLGTAFNADFVVEQSVIVQVHQAELTTELQRAQLLSCLRLSGLRLGLLVNFHVFPVVKGVHRMENNQK